MADCMVTGVDEEGFDGEASPSGVWRTSRGRCCSIPRPRPEMAACARCVAVYPIPGLGILPHPFHLSNF